MYAQPRYYDPGESQLPGGTQVIVLHVVLLAAYLREMSLTYV